MIEYGVHTSQAHIWVHVCPKDASFYWYSRKQMSALCGKFRHVEIKSAKGHLVPLNGNRDCDGGIIKDVGRTYKWFSEFQWINADTDSKAGAIAERMFEQLIAEFAFPIPAKAIRYDEREDQFCGKDYRLTPLISEPDIEIKGDFEGGEWGTGNLFVQTHEYRHAHGERHAHRVVE